MRPWKHGKRFLKVVRDRQAGLQIGVTEDEFLPIKRKRRHIWRTKSLAYVCSLVVLRHR